MGFHLNYSMNTSAGSGEHFRAYEIWIGVCSEPLRSALAGRCCSIGEEDEGSETQQTEETHFARRTLCHSLPPSLCFIQQCRDALWCADNHAATRVCGSCVAGNGVEKHGRPSRKQAECARKTLVLTCLKRSVTSELHDSLRSDWSEGGGDFFIYSPPPPDKFSGNTLSFPLLFPDSSLVLASVLGTCTETGRHATARVVTLTSDYVLVSISVLKIFYPYIQPYIIR